MIYSSEVKHMSTIKNDANHGPSPILEEGKWVKVKEISKISGLTHGIGCSGMTHSAAMASEILPGKTILEALNTDLVCDSINVAMKELFLQIVYGRSQTAFSENGLPIGATLEDLGKGMRSQIGTMFGTKKRVLVI